MKSHPLGRTTALLLFSVVVLCWGLNWPVTKLTVREMPPLWVAAARSFIAAVVLFGLLVGQRNLIVPRRGDIPIVLGIALPHMVAFSCLVAIGIQFVPATISAATKITPLKTPSCQFFTSNSSDTLLSSRSLRLNP